VMRNSVDQGDEQTLGVDKRILLGGERAQPVPEPGSIKSEQPRRQQQIAPAPAPVFMRRTPASPPRDEMPKAAPTAPATPSAPRASVEVIEGAKKRSVDFP